METGDHAFDRALVAMLYLLGERDEMLGASMGRCGGAPRLLRILSSANRDVRVAALAHELTQIGVALDAASFS
jgi:hypothetical protein